MQSRKYHRKRFDVVWILEASGWQAESLEITHKPGLMMICRNGRCLTSKMNLIINTSHALALMSFLLVDAYCLCWMETSSILAAYAGPSPQSVACSTSSNIMFQSTNNFRKQRGGKKLFLLLTQVRIDREWRGVWVARILMNFGDFMALNFLGIVLMAGLW